VEGVAVATTAGSTDSGAVYLGGGAVYYDPTLQASRLFYFRWKYVQWRRLSGRQSCVLGSYYAGNRRFGGVVYLGGGAVYYDPTHQASRLFYFRWKYGQWRRLSGRRSFVLLSSSTGNRRFDNTVVGSADSGALYLSGVPQSYTTVKSPF
jgi:hypothetical protein